MSYFVNLKPYPISRKGIPLLSSLDPGPDSVRKFVADGIKKRTPTFEEDNDKLVEVTKEIKDILCNLYSMKSEWFLYLTLYQNQPQRVEQTIF